MEKAIDNIVDTLKTIFDFNIVRRVFMLAGIAASVATGISIYNWVQEPIYRPLPYTTNEQNINSIVDALEKANIPYKINERSGNISVPVHELHVAKMKLSAAGVQKDDGFNYSFLNDQNKLGTSQFVENARYLRALESDLARTIRSIQGISSAKVHIAIPQHNIFADENTKPTASIIVQTTPGYEGDKEKIRAIVQLVAASVPELDPKHIAITDQYGHDLSSSITQESILNQEQLSYQTNMQRYFEKRIQNLLTPIIGENKASINVNADIDFTQKEEAHEEYDPQQSVVRSEQNMVENSSSSSSIAGVPGALSNTAPNSSNGGNSAGGNQNRNETVKNYEVGKSMRYVRASTPKVNSISVAVVLDNEEVFDEATKKIIDTPIPKEKLEQITALIKSTIGYNKARGDSVTVINSAFIPPKVDEVQELSLWEQPWFWEWAKSSVGIILGFIFLFIVYRKISQEIKPKALEQKSSNQKIAHDDGLVTPEMIRLKNEQLNILRDLANKEPNKVSSIIKKWVAK